MSTEPDAGKDLELNPEDAENITGGMIQASSDGKSSAAGRRSARRAGFEITGSVERDAQADRDAV